MCDMYAHKNPEKKKVSEYTVDIFYFSHEKSSNDIKHANGNWPSYIFATTPKINTELDWASV